MKARALRWLVWLELAGGIALTGHGWVGLGSRAFHAGLLLCALGVADLSVRAARSGRSSAVLLLNTLVSLLVGIVALDLVWPWLERSDDDGPASYSFVEAHGDPRAFVRWHERSVREQKQTGHNTMLDPRGVNPYVLRPGPGRFFESTWWVNSLGFRGPEIPLEKGNRYRIVALGESTTFGATLRADDRPWPEVLQERIARDFVCERPVEVINAGVPGWTLANNLARLGSDILPIDPDLIVSYHGYNGFPYLLREIPSVRVGMRPEAPPRPSPFLSRIENAARIWWFRRRYRAARTIDVRALEMDVHISRYAVLYRELVAAAQARGIGLALASFNMAVTPESPEEVIRFYEPVFPDLRASLLANRLHTVLVRQIAERYGAIFVDTSAGLDGAFEDAYIDPIHLTQTGRDRLAGNVLAGLRDALAAEAGCRPHAVP